MRIRSLIAIASVLSTTVAVQAAYALPSRTLRELRAARCCATRCRHQNGGVAPAARCCGVERGSAEPARLARAATPHPPLWIGLSAPPSGCTTDGPSVQTAGPPEAVPRAGPVFLLTRSLRL